MASIVTFVGPREEGAGTGLVDCTVLVARARFSLPESLPDAPAFIWATSDDGLVPVINSVRFAEKLSAIGARFELHIWPHGPHGLSIAEEETSVNIPDMINEAAAEWIPMSIRWMRGLK